MLYSLLEVIFLKTILNIFFDIAIVSLAALAISLGMKNSYIGYTNSVLTDQALAEFETAIDEENFSSRSDFNPKHGDVIATVQVLGITDKIPVIEGDSEANLSRGATHLSQVGYPGDNRQIFLSAHRDVHFQELQYVNKGDTVVLIMPYGKFEYTVSHTKIVHESEVDVIKTGQLEEDELVLMTCYPFNNITDPTERFLVYAYPK